MQMSAADLRTAASVIFICQNRVEWLPKCNLVGRLLLEIYKKTLKEPRLVPWSFSVSLKNCWGLQGQGAGGGVGGVHHHDAQADALRVSVRHHPQRPRVRRLDRQDPQVRHVSDSSVIGLAVWLHQHPGTSNLSSNNLICRRWLKLQVNL